MLNASLKRSDGSTVIAKSTILPSGAVAGSLGGMREDGAIRADVLREMLVRYTYESRNGLKTYQLMKYSKTSLYRSAR